MAERIGIVGAGFSGLLSAYLLERRFGDRVQIDVWEASGRPGGRVRTTRVPETGASYEAGVAELYDIAGNPQLRRLIRHLGLDTRPLAGTPYFAVGDRVLRDDRALAGLLGRRGIDRLRRFWEQGAALRPPADYALAGRERDNDHPWQRRTFQDVLGGIDDPLCEWFTAMQCHSDLATEPPLTSGLFGMDNLLIDHPGYCTLYTLTAGNEGLTKALADRVRSPVSLDTAVARVTADDETGLRVGLRGPGGDRGDVEVDALIVTLPPAGVRGIRWGDERLRDAVAGHVRHHDHGTAYLRVTLMFRRRFWRREFPDDYFVSDAFGGVTVYDQSPDDGAAGAGIQSWLLGGAPALEYASKPDPEIVAAVLGAMPQAAPAREDLLVRTRVDRWTGVAGVSALPGGVPLRPLRQRHNPDARWPRLLFVGDYLYDATLCGALDSVLYGVSRLDELLAAGTRPAAVETGAAAAGTGSAAAAALELFDAGAAGTEPAAPPPPRSAFFLDERLATGQASGPGPVG